MVSGIPADLAPRDPGRQPDDRHWEAVPDAAGLLRAEILKPDGRRITIYRRSDDGQLDHDSR